MNIVPDVTDVEEKPDVDDEGILVVVEVDKDDEPVIDVKLVSDDVGVVDAAELEEEEVGVVELEDACCCVTVAVVVVPDVDEVDAGVKVVDEVSVQSG